MLSMPGQLGSLLTPHDRPTDCQDTQQDALRAAVLGLSYLEMPWILHSTHTMAIHVCLQGLGGGIYFFFLGGGVGFVFLEKKHLLAENSH